MPRHDGLDTWFPSLLKLLALLTLALQTLVQQLANVSELSPQMLILAH